MGRAAKQTQKPNSQWSADIGPKQPKTNQRHPNNSQQSKKTKQFDAKEAILKKNKMNQSNHFKSMKKDAKPKKEQSRIIDNSKCSLLQKRQLAAQLPLPYKLRNCHQVTSKTQPPFKTEELVEAPMMKAPFEGPRLARKQLEPSESRERSQMKLKTRNDLIPRFQEQKERHASPDCRNNPCRMKKEEELLSGSEEEKTEESTNHQSIEEECKQTRDSEGEMDGRVRNLIESHDKMVSFNFGRALAGVWDGFGEVSVLCFVCAIEP